MLVLTRRPHETIVFPDFQAIVEVVALKSGAVRLGIVAPPEVRVLRGELPDRGAGGRPAEAVVRHALKKAAGPSKFDQMLEKRLAVVEQSVGELRKQVETGSAAEVEASLARLEEDLQLLRRRVHDEAGQGAVAVHEPSAEASAHRLSQPRRDVLPTGPNGDGVDALAWLGLRKG